MVLAMLGLTLERAGYRVASAKSPVEALQIAQADPAAFRLAVIDHLMPGMFGRELLDRLRHLSPGLPAVLVSGLPLGPNGLDTVTLLKPFMPRDLLDAVSTLRRRV